MANKQDRFFFENFISAADYACQAATYLVECLNNFDPDAIGVSIAHMHGIEHAADGKKHEMSAALAKAFVTPVDREDLALISQNIDDVADCIEEVLQQFYMDDIKTVLPEAITFADKLVVCCNMMKEMLREFINFKKPAKLHQMVVDLNHAEEDCDELYLKAVRAVRNHCTDPLEIIFWREIYDCMEKCADACEHVGDCVETVVMKNT